MLWNIFTNPALGKKEVQINENDLPAKDKAEKKGTRIQKENENQEWQKRIKEKKSKRKKSVISIETASSGLFVIT